MLQVAAIAVVNLPLLARQAALHFNLSGLHTHPSSFCYRLCHPSISLICSILPF